MLNNTELMSQVRILNFLKLVTFQARCNSNLMEIILKLIFCQRKTVRGIKNTLL